MTVTLVCCLPKTIGQWPVRFGRRSNGRDMKPLHARRSKRRAECCWRRRFDLLVTDVRLGPFNGLQLGVIARDRMPETRIVVISGFDDPVLKMEAANLGAAYLLKPLTAERLLQFLDGNE